MEFDAWVVVWAGSKLVSSLLSTQTYWANDATTSGIFASEGFENIRTVLPGIPEHQLRNLALNNAIFQFIASSWIFILYPHLACTLI
eukprot:scaffold3851_cov162-Amphora_coffeaeformis.AAC.2